MKIRWLESSNEDEELEIEIKAPRHHPQKIILQRMLSHLDGFALGEKGLQIYRIFFKDIYYVEHREDLTTIHTKTDQFSSSYRLYEVEGFSSLFVRIHKSIVVNISKIQSFRSTFNGKLEVTLQNGNCLEISRKYVNDLKKSLEENPL